MNDPYSIQSEPPVGTSAPTGGSPSSAPDDAGREPDRVTGLLWVAVALLVGLNAVFSVVRPDDLLTSLTFGVPALLCVVLLVVRYVGRRA